LNYIGKNKRGFVCCGKNAQFVFDVPISAQKEENGTVRLPYNYKEFYIKTYYNNTKHSIIK